MAASLDSAALPGYADLRRLMNPPALAAVKVRLLDRQAAGKLPADLPSDIKQAMTALPAAQLAARSLTGQ